MCTGICLTCLDIIYKNFFFPLQEELWCEYCLYPWQYLKDFCEMWHEPLSYSFSPQHFNFCSTQLMHGISSFQMQMIWRSISIHVRNNTDCHNTTPGKRKNPYLFQLEQVVLLKSKCLKNSWKKKSIYEILILIGVLYQLSVTPPHVSF